MTGTINPALFGMPDATTTGVQAGVTLTAYKGPMTITTPGTVIENVTINGELDVQAANVTIRNCVINSNGWWGVNGDQAPNLTVANCKIIGGGLTNSGILGGGTFVGNDISNVSIGIQLKGGASTVSGNYIHDLYYGNGAPHYDGVVALGTQNHVVIQNNTISMPDSSGTAAVFVSNDFGSVNDVTVRNNLMFGDPAYTLAVDQKTGQSGVISNITFANNYLEKGYYGYVSVQGTTATVSNNVQWNNDVDPTPYPSSPPTGGTGTGTGNTAPAAPAAPVIASFSPDTGVVGDKITSNSTPTLTGTAVAGSTVNVFDGSTKLGTATANSSGSWSYTVSKLNDGVHHLTAIDVDSAGNKSVASADFAITIDTQAPVAPTLAHYSQAGAAVGASTTLNDLLLKGTAEANSTVSIWDNGKQIGTVAAGSAGTWSYDTGTLSTGAHSFTSKATDAAGNTSVASVADAVTVNATSATDPTTPVASVAPVKLTGLSGDAPNHIVTITGTADANSQIKFYDNGTLIGSTTTKSYDSASLKAYGSFSFTTAKPLSDTVHTITAQEYNSAGKLVGASSGAIVIGSSSADTLKSTSGNDILSGHGGADTFVFNAHFGNDVIKDFAATGSAHDVVQFSNTVFTNFASVLSHATQQGSDVVIASGADSLTLKSTKLGSLTSQDFHFA